MREKSLKLISFSLLFLFFISYIPSMDQTSAKEVYVNHSPEVILTLDERAPRCPYYPMDQRYVYLTGNVRMKLNKYNPDDMACRVNISLTSEELIHDDPDTIVLTSSEKVKYFKILIKIPEDLNVMEGNLLHLYLDWHTVDNIYSASFKAEIVDVGMYPLSDLHLTIEEEVVEIYEGETKIIPFRLDNFGVGDIRIETRSETDDETLEINIMRRSWKGFDGEGSRAGEIEISHLDQKSGTSSVTVVFEDHDSVPAKKVSKTITVNKKIYEPKKRTYFGTVILPLLILAPIFLAIEITVTFIAVRKVMKMLEKRKRERELIDHQIEYDP